ncbi:MAG: type I 3-dehydroquinate dehydratase [Lachnospiraceae bacterium]|nr:type I 3-dehydroquinate dehydratase [Lachnospiraceae bacterium]
MKTVKVKNVIIGEGMPKICVPIAGRSREEIIRQAERITGVSCDLVEIRIDYFEQFEDIGVVGELLETLNKIISQPVIFTLRTTGEGGEAEISKEKYLEYLKLVLATGMADFIDVELFQGEELVKEIVREAHRLGVKVILSNHDFNKTPVKFEIIARLIKMQSLNADIAKIAVMPSTVDDLLTLLSATHEVNSQFGEIPIVTMSMGKTGILSRMAGQIFGSAITFGTVGISSAPGQLEAGELKDMLELINRNLEKE